MKQSAQTSRRTPSKGRKRAEARRPTESPTSKQPLCIVAMGGSAGALEAFEQFFSKCPPDTGVAFVLVPHLDPTHKGIMLKLGEARSLIRVSLN